MSRSPSPNKCCTKAANPWVPDSSGNYPRGGCNCDCSCVNAKSKLLRVRSASPPRNISDAEKVAYLDTQAIAFSNSARSVQVALDAALIAPRSYSGSVGVIFSQDAAAAANAKNLENTLLPQAASVAAASSAIAATKASRLAYRLFSEASYALNNVYNVNLIELAALVAKVKLAADALVTASNSANIAAQSVYTTASSVSTGANTAVANATAALVQLQCNAATAECNAVPGSTYQNMLAHDNMVAITTANTHLNLLNTAAENALSAENAANAVAITTAKAYIGALEAQATAVVTNTPFLTAASTAAAAATAFSAYKILSSGDNLTASHHANNVAAAAKAALPPLQYLKDLVTATSAASALANTAAANARTLSSSLDVKARNAAAPLHNPATPQMIAKQTAAAERFGAAAAADAARIARQSAAPPAPPFIPAPRLPVYSARMPPTTKADLVAASQLRAAAAAKAMAFNPRIYRRL